MSDVNDNRRNDPQQREDDLLMEDEILIEDALTEPGAAERREVVNDGEAPADAADSEEDRTGVLGDPRDQNIGEDTGMLE
ncbi:hypothetical protein [Microterricola viridarii]|uniref:Uncharacterized protein n=1 Tax=Microterricola viridarii TaxID=412690 RepID=A0A0X8E4Y2_9MICO|nr:hypothetical protein [Microterricola viridarii]AMB59488.1 hypothetical protein AWU67_12150 [Microterricola viridarii]